MKKLVLLATTSVLAMGIASFNSVRATDTDEDTQLAIHYALQTQGTVIFPAPEELLDRYQVLCNSLTTKIITLKEA